MARWHWLLPALMLLSPKEAWPTTRAEDEGQSQTLLCRAEGVFLGPQFNEERIEFRGRAQAVKKVFWRVRLEKKSSPNPSICPSGEHVEIRVRGSTFRDENGIKIATYPVDFREPEANTRARFLFFFVSGVDSRTRKAYEEWVLRGVEHAF